MWPWGHVAVAYLLYTASVSRRSDLSVAPLAVLALAVGSQAPDLVDKPFAWTFDVLPGGRTLAHSIFFAALVLATAYAVARRVDRVEPAAAFGFGYVSHLVADVPPSVLTGDLSGTEYFLWPLLEVPPEEPVAGILDAFLNYYAIGTYEWVQLGLFAVAAVVWYRDGTPGLEWIDRLPGRPTDR